MPSRTIFVLKQDGTFEPFDSAKLRGCLLRVLAATQQEAHWAQPLATAVRCYLARRRIRCLTSAAVLEMALKVLRTVGLSAAAGALEDEHTARLQARSRVTVCHRGGVRTAWSKGWLARRAEGSWKIGRTAARIVAGTVERELLARPGGEVDRGKVVRRLAAAVSAFGLAGPVRPEPVKPAV